MRISRHTFDQCTLSVHRGVAQKPDNPTETFDVTVLRITNPEQAETYDFPMNDELRRWLIKQLSGVQIVRPAEIAH